MNAARFALSVADSAVWKLVIGGSWKAAVSPATVLPFLTLKLLVAGSGP